MSARENVKELKKADKYYQDYCSRGCRYVRASCTLCAIL